MTGHKWHISILPDLCISDNLLGLSLPSLDAQLSNVELAAAPPVGPAEQCILLPAQLHDHQVSDVSVGGDEERQSGVTIKDRSAEQK